MLQLGYGNTNCHSGFLIFPLSSITVVKILVTFYECNSSYFLWWHLVELNLINIILWGIKFMWSLCLYRSFLLTSYRNIYVCVYICIQYIYAYIYNRILLAESIKIVTLWLLLDGLQSFGFLSKEMMGVLQKNVETLPWQAIQGINTSVGNTDSLNLKKQWRWNNIIWVSHKAQKFLANQGELLGEILTHSWKTLNAMSFFPCFHILLKYKRAVRAHSPGSGAIPGLMVISDSSGTERERQLPEPIVTSVKKRKGEL